MDDITQLLVIAGNPDLGEDERRHALDHLTIYYADEVPLVPLRDLLFDPLIGVYVCWILPRLSVRAPVDAIIQALRSGDDPLASEAAHALGKINNPVAVPALLEAVHEHRELWVRRNALRALGELQAAEVLPELVMSLSNRDPVLRSAAAYALGRIRDARAVPSLIAVLGDRDIWVITEAIYALGRLGAVAMIKPLAHHATPVVRQAVADVIAQYPPHLT